MTADTPVPDVKELATKAGDDALVAEMDEGWWYGDYVRDLVAENVIPAVLAAVTPVIRQERDEARAALSIVEENFRELERERDHLVLAVKARDVAVREADRLRAAMRQERDEIRALFDVTAASRDQYHERLKVEAAATRLMRPVVEAARTWRHRSATHPTTPYLDTTRLEAAVDSYEKTQESTE